MKIGLRLRRLKVNANINCLLPAPRTLYGKKQKRWHHKVYRRDQVAILNSVQSWRPCIVGMHHTLSVSWRQQKMQKVNFLFFHRILMRSRFYWPTEDVNVAPVLHLLTHTHTKYPLTDPPTVPQTDCLEDDCGALHWLRCERSSA